MPANLTFPLLLTDPPEAMKPFRPNLERRKMSLSLAVPYTALWALFNTGLFHAGYSISLMSSALLLPLAGGFFMASMYEGEERRRYMKHKGIEDEKLLSPDETRKIELHAARMAFQMMLPYMVAQVTMYYVLEGLAKELSAGALLAGAPLEAQMLTMLVGGLVFGAAMASFEAIRLWDKGEKLNSKEAMTKFGKLFVIGLFTGVFAQFTALIPGMNHAYGAGMPGWTANVFAVMGQLLTFTVGFAALIHVNEPDLVEALQADPLSAVPEDKPVGKPWYSNYLDKIIKKPEPAASVLATPAAKLSVDL